MKHSEEWGEPANCEAGDNCQYCHTRTEQQFHPEIYKSTKCNDVQQAGYCPRSVFCAFAHVERESQSILPANSAVIAEPNVVIYSHLAYTISEDMQGDNGLALSDMMSNAMDGKKDKNDMNNVSYRTALSPRLASF